MLSLVLRNPRLVIRDSLPRRCGYTYNCPTCGESWAILEGTERYIILSLPCAKHGRENQTGGSLLKPLQWWEFRTLPSTLNNLDPAILVYEVSLRL